MSSSPAPRPDPGTEDVLGLDAAATLAFVVERRRRADREAAEELRAVTHWADLHRTTDVAEGAIDPEVHATLGEDQAGWESALRLADEGAFTVAEFAVCEVAAALRMSEAAARGYLGQALELRDRLPRLWHQVLVGALPAWKARLVAKETIPLTQQAAAYVDTQLAPFAHQVSPWRVHKAVQAATLRHDPELAATRAAQAAERRGVWVEDHLDGTSSLAALTDTPTPAPWTTPWTRSPPPWAGSAAP